MNAHRHRYLFLCVAMLILNAAAAEDAVAAVAPRSSNTARPANAAKEQRNDLSGGRHAVTQESTGSREAAQETGTVRGESEDDQTPVGFADDPPLPDQHQAQPLAADAAYEHFLPLEALGRAWDTGDSRALADFAISAATGERTLLRARDGISTETLWAAAIAVSRLRHDGDSLARLTDAAKRLDRADLAAIASQSSSALGALASQHSTIAVNPLEVTQEQFSLLRELARAIDRASLIGDNRFLQDVKFNLPVMFPGDAYPQGILRGALEHRLKTAAHERLSPSAVGELAKLAATSRFDLGKFGGSVSHVVRHGGGVLAGGVHHAEGVASKVGKHAGAVASQVAKHAGLVAAEEAWGEAGRIGYPAAAATMEARYADRSADLYFATHRNDRQVLAPHFGEDTLMNVRVMWGADPLDEWHAGNLGSIRSETEAQTYGYTVYIRDALETLDTYGRLEILCHELTHVKQYERYGRRLDSFGYNYFKEYKRAGENYRNNVLEREAYSNQDNLTPTVFNDYVTLMTGDGSKFLAPLTTDDGRTIPAVRSGVWQTQGRSATFTPEGKAIIKTSGGSATFNYRYDFSTGQLIGYDGRGHATTTTVVWLNSNTFIWESPSGTRNYVRSSMQFK